MLTVIVTIIRRDGFHGKMAEKTMDRAKSCILCNTIDKERKKQNVQSQDFLARNPVGSQLSIRPGMMAKRGSLTASSYKAVRCDVLYCMALLRAFPTAMDRSTLSIKKGTQKK